MGNKSSLKKNSNSNSNSKPTAKEQMVNAAQDLERMAKEAEASIAEDPRLPNVLSNFAKLLQKPNLLSFEELVSASKENWGKILEVLKKLAAEKEIGEEQVQEMEKIYKDFWVLLLRTRLGIEILIKKCNLQKRNVGMLLEIIQECRSSKGALSADDQMARQECIEQLGKWLNTGEIDTLIAEWADMQTRLEFQQKKWEKTSAEISRKKRRQMYCYLALAFLGVVIVAGSVVLIVVTCGGATPVVAVAGSSLAPVAVTALTALEVTAIVCSGVACAVGGAIGARAAKKCLDAHRSEKQMLTVVIRVRALLSTMCKSSKAFQFELNKMKCENQINEDYDTFKDDKSLRKMEAALKAITEYLDDYISQGRVVIQTVDKACQEMIDC